MTPPAPDPQEADPRFTRIWAAVAAIPRGQVATYGGIAVRAGLPGRARLVARALGAAPRALALPWHRVVAAGGRIALPEGSDARATQVRRLEREGVAFRRGKVDLARHEAGAAESLDALLWAPSPRR
jgi:methylated-DNA-protein-cysteine methyltransferase related protein